MYVCVCVYECVSVCLFKSVCVCLLCAAELEKERRIRGRWYYSIDLVTSDRGWEAAEERWSEWE